MAESTGLSQKKSYVELLQVFVSIYALFNNAISSSDYNNSIALRYHVCVCACAFETTDV